MLRIIAALVMILLAGAGGFGADLVSMKLCATKNYDSAAMDCAAGKALEGDSVRIDPYRIGSLQFLTVLNTSGDEQIYHVWIFGKSTTKVMVYDSTDRILREAWPIEMNWLKDRHIQGARVIVKVSSSPSEYFRVRSSKKITPAMTGLWEVRVYNAADATPIGSMKFMVSLSDDDLAE